MNSYETSQDARQDARHDARQDAHSSDHFSQNPIFGIWAGFWQRYYENSMRMMSIWINLPGEIMATNKASHSPEDRMQGSVKAYENAVNESQQVTKDTTNAAFEAGNKTKSRMAG